MTIEDIKMVELSLKNITKKFGSFTANDNISLKINKGTIHAILGENGAGKTTLMNILSGLYRPDEGEIYINDQLVKINSSKSAIDQGIGMIHQHFMLVPQLSVLENIILGTQGEYRLKLKQKTLEIQELIDNYGLEINLDTKVENISVGMQQRVEILKVLYRGAKLLILDEPTAVLTPAEINNFFKILRQLVNKGNTIIFISHKLEEVIKLCDFITVLRMGKLMNTFENKNLNPQTLANMMIGEYKTINLTKTTLSYTETILKVDNLVVKNLDNISFQIKAGEILGVAGVDGNGQQELVSAIMGFIKAKKGKIQYKEIDITNWTTEDIIKQLSIAYIPEDRKTTGLVSSLTIGKNLILKQYYSYPFNQWGMLQKKAIQTRENEVINDFDIRGVEPNITVGKLSGGNQQKIILARELSNHSQLIIAMQPTRGLDIVATEYIQQQLLKARENGAAILYISTELEEVRKMSDRLAIIYRGQFIDIINPNTDVEKIGLLMMGVKPD
ncbi:sugar ABC transporter ATP binding protein [Crocosphaera chwakensis CCY0110]|uniref:Sugar ABC transporter ATP binding protein n=2 Tax=Crocosphaera TaxID=263510 RepID=A3IK39_9CHRO|nr:sugar ABC transporter ATP binding protein [Crocosphaera chwakensis CCY0110]